MIGRPVDRERNECFMERKKPVPGEFYRHFKGKIYQIRELAKDSETGEDMVVYQGMYPPFQVWVRSLSVFLDSLDHEKYPECRQQYRFEQAAFRDQIQQDAKQVQQDAIQERKSDGMAEISKDGEPVSDLELRTILINDQGEKLLTGRMTDEEIARRGFLALLDAETYREKRQILVGLRDYMNELYLNNLAAALDVVLEDGSSQEHYDTLLHCLETYEKYEGGRLRR